MLAFNIYLCGVGGQGIGLLCEILLRAADHAGLVARAVDTHGLAQRGGTVISHIRLGEAVFSPLIGDGQAHLPHFRPVQPLRQGDTAHAHRAGQALPQHGIEPRRALHRGAHRRRRALRGDEACQALLEQRFFLRKRELHCRYSAATACGDPCPPPHST